jgi:hypothetical protein
MSQCCQFIKSGSEICKFKPKYGGFCYKHRQEFLLENGQISQDRFTGLSKDYLKQDLVKYRKNQMRRTSVVGSKEQLFEEINNHITSLNGYHEDNKVKEIIKIQSLFRGKSVRDNIMNLKCNNDEDFYTYDLLKEIPSKYFYSYTDNGGLRWGFDIRSLDKLLRMQYPNPYTTEIVPHDIQKDVKSKIEILKLEPDYEDLTDTIERDRKDTIKQKIVDLFSFIEQSGYTCQIDWFTSLSIRRLKELYKQLEDIWNYRSQLTEVMKRSICPPNADIFKTPMIEVMNYNVKEDLQELILHEVMKFTQANTDSDRKLGFMYFLIAFGQVSQPCYIAHIEWLGFMMQINSA